MMNLFRPVLIGLFGLLSLVSCLKKQSKKDTVENLKAAMNTYLNHQPQIDTSRVKFQVLEVVFYEEKANYLCEFKVNMKQKTPTRLIDTTGTMNARVSKDFKDISRNF